MHRTKVSILQATKAYASRWATLQVVWIFIDLAATIPAFYLATILRFAGSISEAQAVLGPISPRALLFGALSVAGLMLTGMYRTRQRVLPAQFISHAAVSVLIGGLLNIVAFYFFPILTTGRGVLLLAMFIAFLFIVAIRRAFTDAGEGLVKRRRVAVIGAGRAAQKIAKRRRRADCRRYEVVAYVTTPGDSPPEDGVELYPLVEDIDHLFDIQFDEAVLALDDRRGAISAKALLDIRQHGANIIPLIDFLEREAGQVDIDVADPAWFIFTEGCHVRPGYLIVKRTLDILGSLALLVGLSPALLLVCLALFLEGKGKAPVLYRQQRVGLKGVTFELLKFRSMSVDAERDGPAWASKDDDRVTRVGKVIRRLRLDELPQLVNILKGQMSLIGPRPERPEFVDELALVVPMYRYRQLVKPGLAGWAQLSFPYGASVNDACEKLKYDLFYIKNASCLLDVFILAHTLEVVIWGQSLSMSGRPNETYFEMPSSQLLNWQPRQLPALRSQVRDN